MLRGRQILIVEDEFFIAAELASAVEDKGGVVVGPFASIAETKSALEAKLPTAAILDAMLVDGDVTPVAQTLIDADVPIVFYTATGVPPELVARHGALPVVAKPVAVTRVLDVLAEVLAIKAEPTD